MRPLDRVIGYNEIKEELYRIIDVLNNPKKYKALGASQPHGIMFAGEPGIGKSLLAKCFIEETGRKSFVVRKDRPDGEFVNYIKKTFNQAKDNAPSIVLLDDMDKFANEDADHKDAEEYVTIQSCIDDVKEYDIFVMATVNDLSNLPSSLKRKGRFDKVYQMDFPKREDAKAIVEYYLSNKKVADTIDVDEVVHMLDGRNCAALETVVNEAAIIAAYKGKKLITQEELREVCIKLFFDLSSRNATLSNSDRRKIAVHEAGHTVISELQERGIVCFVSVTSQNTRVPGITSRKAGANLYNTLDLVEARIRIALAGKAATEIVSGEIDTGSFIDMEKALSIIRKLFDDYTVYGFDSWCHGIETSQTVYDNLDIATKSAASRYYMETKKLLIENRAFLDAIVDGLMEKGTLFADDIAAIRESLSA